MGHRIRVLHWRARSIANRITRPYAVTHAQHRHLVAEPRCRACGSTKNVQAHHVRPYHLFPAVAADPGNFITLCMDREECHLMLGHGGKFKAWNPNVVSDAAEAFGQPDRREAIRDRAKAYRRVA